MPMSFHAIHPEYRHRTCESARIPIVGHETRKEFEEAMSIGVWIAIAVIVIVVVAVVAWALAQRRRSEQLRQRFGPEYDRAVQQYGQKSNAEAVLEARQSRAEHIHLHPISTEDQARLEQSWGSVESRFVDDPAGAVAAADDLVTEVMRARGYPEGDFEQRVGDLSATHPHLADDYRTVHETALASRRGEGSTEDLRKAMVTYKGLFENLLETRGSERKEAA